MKKKTLIEKNANAAHKAVSLVPDRDNASKLYYCGIRDSLTWVLDNSNSKDIVNGYMLPKDKEEELNEYMKKL